MHVKQKFSILFYLKRKKINKEGTIPVYVRITIDGLKDEIAMGFNVLSDDWSNETKVVKSADARYKVLNKKIGQTKADIESTLI
jgi:hypothetical protein